MNSVWVLWKHCFQHRGLDGGKGINILFVVTLFKLTFILLLGFLHFLTLITHIYINYWWQNCKIGCYKEAMTFVTNMSWIIVKIMYFSFLSLQLEQNKVLIFFHCFSFQHFFTNSFSRKQTGTPRTFNSILTDLKTLSSLNWDDEFTLHLIKD